MKSDNINFEKQTIKETINHLKVDMNKGLTNEEAKNRLNKYGKNEIPEKEETTLQRILRRFWGPIPWMIEVAAILSAVVQKWEDFGIIAALLIVNAGMDFWQESKALNVLKVLKNNLAHKATVKRDGAFTEIDAKELVIGDIIKIKIGEILPADV